MRYRNAVISGLDQPGLLSEVNHRDGDWTASALSPNPKCDSENHAATSSRTGC
jgi:hypothetical protein